MMRNCLLGCLVGLGFVCMLWQGGMFGMGAEQTVLSGKRIVIDVGHGGIDSGAAYYGLTEKKINLQIALKLGEMLTGSGAEVVYTRTEDVDYYTRGKGGKRADLLKRIALIQEADADVFISIHCNAAKNADYRGAQVFYHTRNEENQRLAGLMQTQIAKLDAKNRRQAAENKHILLLSSLSVTGVLVEVGYLSNEEEAHRLADETYQMRLAEALMQSLFLYFTEKSA